MITITDAHLNDPEAGSPNDLFAHTLWALQAELEVAVYAGTGTVVISWGQIITGLVGEEPPPPESQPPIVITDGIPGRFEGVVSDLHLSRLFAAWTRERGGALRLRAMFEEEGTEVRGGLADIDLTHLQLDVFLLPSLDPTNTVVWALELGVETAGGLSGVARGQIEDALLGGPIVGLIADALGAFTAQLNGLLFPEDTIVTSIDVDDGEAHFENARAGDQLLAVVFDAVEVHDDTDGLGQGELSFAATVSGIDTGWSEPVSAASGTLVPLEGAAWRTDLTLEQGQSISVRFEARDDDGKNTEALGTIDLDLDPGDAPFSLQLTDSTGAFTLLMRVVVRGVPVRPPGTRRIRVTVPSAEVRRDLDAGGRGDVQFWALVDDQPTQVSAEEKVKGADDPVVGLVAADGSALAVELFVPEGEDLRVRVVGWDNDPGQRDWLGEATLVMPGAAIGATGEPEQVAADTGDFVAAIMIVDLEAVTPVDDDEQEEDEGGEDDQPVLVARTVVFDSLAVVDDEDGVGAGEIVATVGVAGVPRGSAEPVDVSAGTALPLVGADWRADINVPVDGTFELTARVVDVDGRVDDADQDNDDLLGTASLVLGAHEDFLGDHVLADADGSFTFRLRVLDPALASGTSQAAVRFEEVEILRDHTTVGRGAFWCRGTVSGFPVGDDARFEAGPGDVIVLDGAAWTRSLGVAEGGELDLAFEVFEARDDDHVSLGTATARVAFPWADGVLEATSDAGDFALRFRVWDPARGGPDRLRVTFLEVAVLDDGEPSSEGELYFLAGANEQRSGLSVLHKARPGETLALVGAPWALEPSLYPEDDLTVTFSAYAADADAFAVLDRVEQRFSLAEAWGLGEHVVGSADGRFRLRCAVAPAADDALPDVPGVVPLLVEFTAVEVHEDGDGTSRGELTFAGELNGSTVLQTGEHKTGSGETAYLGEPLAPRTVWPAPGQDVEVALAASEHDGRSAARLGTSRRIHRAVDGWDLGAHEVRAPGGAITARWRVDRADGPRVRVKFLHVHVLDDEEPVGRGDLVCEGRVNGASTGPSLKLKAGSDGTTSADDLKSDLFLGGPRWRKTLSYAPDRPQLDVRFTVTELDGLSGDDLLGTATWDAADVLTSVTGIQLLTLDADSGRFTVTLIVQRLS